MTPNLLIGFYCNHHLPLLSFSDKSGQPYVNRVILSGSSHTTTGSSRIQTSDQHHVSAVRVTGGSSNTSHTRQDFYALKVSCPSWAIIDSLSLALATVIKYMVQPLTSSFNRVWVSISHPINILRKYFPLLCIKITSLFCTAITVRPATTVATILPHPVTTSLRRRPLQPGLLTNATVLITSFFPCNSS